MITKNNQKGVSIYLVVVMMSILLSAVLGMTSIIIGGVKIVENLGYSIKAFHATDTGIEAALYNAKINAGSCDDFSGAVGTADYIYEITMSTTGSDCSSAGTTITSTGHYLTVQRKIEVSY
jgi:hypothetical protein